MLILYLLRLTHRYLHHVVECVLDYVRAHVLQDVVGVPHVVAIALLLVRMDALPHVQRDVQRGVRVVIQVVELDVMDVLVVVLAANQDVLVDVIMHVLADV